MKLKLTALILILGGFSCILYIRSLSKINNSPDNNANIVSYYITDIDRDGKEELLVITASSSNADSANTVNSDRNSQEDKFNDDRTALINPEKHGDLLSIYSDFTLKNNKPYVQGEPVQTYELWKLMPSKVQAGDVDGDGFEEITVCVYKTVKFDNKPDKRPFFYSTKSGALAPFWLGSRLARPFSEYTLYDLDQDGADEIVSIERLQDGSEIIVMYDWKGLGFEVNAMSEPLKAKASFANNIHFKEENLKVKTGGAAFILELKGERIILN